MNLKIVLDIFIFLKTPAITTTPRAPAGDLGPGTVAQLLGSCFNAVRSDFIGHTFETELYQKYDRDQS